MATTLADKAYEILVDELFWGGTAPGALCTGRELFSRFGMNRTPIRQAIDHLQDEGLVEKFFGGGFQIVQLSKAELIDIFYLQQALECQAINQPL